MASVLVTYLSPLLIYYLLAPSKPTIFSTFCNSGARLFKLHLSFVSWLVIGSDNRGYGKQSARLEELEGNLLPPVCFPNGSEQTCMLWLRGEGHGQQWWLSQFHSRSSLPSFLNTTAWQALCSCSSGVLSSEV